MTRLVSRLALVLSLSLGLVATVVVSPAAACGGYEFTAEQLEHQQIRGAAILWLQSQEYVRQEILAAPSVRVRGDQAEVELSHRYRGGSADEVPRRSIVQLRRVENQWRGTGSSDAFTLPNS